MKEEENKEMVKDIYVCLVLFVTLMMSIVGAVGVFMGVAGYIVPNDYIEPADALRQIIESLGWIIIPLPVFLYYRNTGTVITVTSVNFSDRPKAKLKQE